MSLWVQLQSTSISGSSLRQRLELGIIGGRVTTPYFLKCKGKTLELSVDVGH